MKSRVQTLRARIRSPWRWKRLVKDMNRLRIYHRSSSAHARDNSNLSISNNGGEAESNRTTRMEWERQGVGGRCETVEGHTPRPQTVRGSRGWDVSIPEWRGWQTNNSNILCHLFNCFTSDETLRTKVRPNTFTPPQYTRKDWQRLNAQLGPTRSPKPSKIFQQIHFFFVEELQEIKSISKLWEKRGDGENVPAGVEGRKMTLVTQTNRNHSRTEQRNYIDS